MVGTIRMDQQNHVGEGVQNAVLLFFCKPRIWNHKSGFRHSTVHFNIAKWFQIQNRRDLSQTFSELLKKKKMGGRGIPSLSWKKNLHKVHVH